MGHVRARGVGRRPPHHPVSTGTAGPGGAAQPGPSRDVMDQRRTNAYSTEAQGTHGGEHEDRTTG